MLGNVYYCSGTTITGLQISVVFLLWKNGEGKCIWLHRRTGSCDPRLIVMSGTMMTLFNKLSMNLLIIRYNVVLF